MARTLVHRPVRVVFLLPSFEVGGAERVVVRTVGGLDRLRYEAVVVAFARGSGRIAAEAERSGLRTSDLGFRSRWSPAPLVRLLRLLRDLRPEILVTMMFHAGLAGRIIGRLAGVPIIISSERVVGWENRTRVFLNRATSSLVDAVTTNSSAGVQFWSRALRRAEGVFLIPNGVDTGTFSPGPPQSRPTVMIGNLSRMDRDRSSGQADFLRALSLLRQMETTSWRCVLGGDGPDRRALEAFRDDLALTDLVSFVGHVDDPAGFLRGLDLYVQPSIVEGMPNAVLEAMATGLPVAATAVGGTPEAVVQERTGLLVPPSNPAVLAAALLRLVSEPEARHRFGAAGRARVVEMFSVERMVAETEALFEHLLG
ncbi:MAG: glycosyltransferase, partial [Vicinamibacterales bacterium]